MLSMTGYGQARRETDGRIMTAEVRCVNHRFLDLGLRLPRALTALESLTRQLAGEKLVRGHADITVTYLNKGFFQPDDSGKGLCHVKR